MYFVHPGDSERFSLRMLLLYRKGCCSFQDLRTANNITYDSFKEACCALGFAKDDNESKTCLEEASSFASAMQMRDLFVLILLNCCPSNPRQLWENFKTHMVDDILNEFRIIYSDNNIQINDQIYQVALNKINNILNRSGNDLSNFANMPEIIEQSFSEIANQTSKLISDELAYDTAKLSTELNIGLPQLNFEQKNAYDKIISRVNQDNDLGTINISEILIIKIFNFNI